MSIKIIAMYRCSKQRRARKRIGGRKETKRLRTIGNWLQCRSHSSMHLQVPSYICAFQERKREKKKKKKKGRVFEQSNRRLFIMLSRYIYIKLEVFHSFFFSSIYFIPFSIHLYRITYAIFIRSRFFTFFSFISQPLLCYRRATACTCDYSACKVNLCSNKSCIYSKGGEGGKRGERERKKGGWDGEKLQEFCPLSRFNLISTNWGFCSFIVHVSSPTNYTSRFAKIFTRKFLTYANNQSI